MKAEYKRRVVDEILDFYLESMCAVLIEGPKWCGKTRTGEEHAKSVVKLQDPDNVDKYRAAIKAKPSILLEGPTPRLIDEWQDFPILWNAVRHLVDERGEDGQFILTGSAVPCEEKKDNTPPRHTGTGRIVRMRMRPMSLWESGESTGEISLSALFDGAGEVRHYRDQTGLEADMIVALKDGRWGAIEVKLGAGDIDSAAEGLKKLRAKVDVGRMGHPSFLMILTGTDLGYTRDDGVVVCPLGCLRP